MKYCDVFDIDIFTDLVVYGTGKRLEQFRLWLDSQKTLDEIMNKCKELSLKVDCSAKYKRSGNTDGEKIAAHINSLAKLNGVFLGHAENIQ